MGPLPFDQIEADGTGFRALGSNAVTDCLLGIFWHQGFQLRLGSLVLLKDLPRISKQTRKLRPGIGRAHIDDPHRLDPWPRRFNPEQPRWLAAQNHVPELNKADVFECQAWTKDQLGRTYTLVGWAPDRNSNIPFLSFIACPRFNEPSDVRVLADRIPSETPFAQTEPVIVLPYGTINILLEGYLRGVLFMRSPNPDAKILVWFPVIPQP